MNIGNSLIYFPLADASLGSIIENGDVDFDDYVENIIEGVSGQQENDSCTSFENSVMDADRSLHVATSTNYTIGQGSHVPSGFIDYHLSLNCYHGTDDGPFVADSSIGILPNDICSQLWTNEEMIKAENAEFYADMACMSSVMPTSTTGEISFQDSQIMLSDSDYPSFFYDNVIFDNKTSVPLSTCASSMSCDGTASNFQGIMGNLNMKSVNKSLSHAQAPIASEKQFDCVERGGGKMIQLKHIDSDFSKGKSENFHVEDDSDVCIIEGMSHPFLPSQSANIGNSLSISQSSRYVDSQPDMVGSTRLKACDERNILQVALQVGTFILWFLSLVALGICGNILHPIHITLLWFIVGSISVKVRI